MGPPRLSVPVTRFQVLGPLPVDRVEPDPRERTWLVDHGPGPGTSLCRRGRVVRRGRVTKNLFVVVTDVC